MRSAVWLPGIEWHQRILLFLPFLLYSCHLYFILAISILHFYSISLCFKSDSRHFCLLFSIKEPIQSALHNILSCWGQILNFLCSLWKNLTNFIGSIMWMWNKIFKKSCLLTLFCKCAACVTQMQRDKNFGLDKHQLRDS